MTTVGVLHPGAMGITVATACGGDVIWCSAGRSAATVERATAAGLGEVGSLAELVRRSEVIVSVCPPGSAVAVAGGVAALGYDRIYVDANATAPVNARTIAERFDRFVDGGIIGPPANTPGTTRIYLSGDDAADVAALWAGSALDARPIDGGAGAASAVKMAYATWTKASSAMLLAVRALAAAEGVTDALLAEWAISQPGVAARSEVTASATAPKAWRFDGEMAEIARSMTTHGLPAGFGEAAGDIYARLAEFRDRDDVTLADVLEVLIDTMTG